MDKMDFMGESEISHIRIDHYSWPRLSPYRVFEKYEFNKSCVEMALKLSETDNPVYRKIVCSLLPKICIDPDNVPEHPSWNDNEFEKAALKSLFEIIQLDRNIDHCDALKLARRECAKAKTSRDIKSQEIYQRIVFELLEAKEYEFQELIKEIYGELK